MPARIPPFVPVAAAAAFLALLLTDGAVLLAGCFDWGPVALSLLLRLALLGLWIGRGCQNRFHPSVEVALSPPL